MLVNAYCTLREPPPLSFAHQLHARRDHTDPELVPHLNGFMGFVMGGGQREMNQSRYHVLGHLQRVRHHLAMEVEDEDLDAFAGWARAANAILFLRDGSVRTPEGDVLVDPESGDADDDADVPYPPDAVRRKQASDAALAARGLKVPRSLPPAVAEVEVELRSAAEVARRCLALFACAVRGESLASGDAIPVADLRARMPVAFASLSPSEEAFMADASPPQQDVVRHTWRYEALAVLAWALSEDGELAWPDRTCDVPALARAMLARDGARWPTEARLRAPAAILDALDQHLRLHWATTDARMGNRPPPAGLEPGVVFERHYALNWLTRFQDADWDDVDTPT